MPNTHSSIIVGPRPGNKHQRLHAPAPAPASLPCQQMASRKTLLAAAAMVLVATASLLVPATASRKKTTFTVGDDSGWDVGVDYDAWKRGKKFKVGDTLVFKPNNAGQDVVLVDEQSFRSCVSPDNAQVLSSGNPVAVNLGQSGKLFFICDAEGECASGMKLAINVQK